MPVTPDDVRRVAALARIGVPEDRVPQLVRELGAILDHMDALARVTAPATARDAGAMPLAVDAPPSVALTRPREAFAPRARQGFFLVPRLDTHDGAGSS